MLTQISSIELKYLVQELSFLENSKISKIFQPEKNELVLQIHVPNQGKYLLRVLVPKYMYLSTKRKEAEKQQGFCINIRHFINNGFIKKISQIESERVVEFLIEKKEGAYKLIIEFFGKGNIILVYEDKIVAALYMAKYKDREIKTKANYVYPRQEHNLFNLKYEDVESALKKSEKESIVKFLAIDLGLGGVFAEELCLLTNIKKNSEISAIKKPEITGVLSAVKQLLTKKREPIAVFKDSSLTDILPFDLVAYKEHEKKHFDAFNQALDQYLSEEIEKVQKEKDFGQHNQEIQRIKKIIEAQQEQINKAEQTIKEDTGKAELIYHNYALVKEVIEELNKAKKKYSWKEIKQRLAGHKAIKEVNEKEGTVVIEIN